MPVLLTSTKQNQSTTLTPPGWGACDKPLLGRQNQIKQWRNPSPYTHHGTPSTVCGACEVMHTPPCTLTQQYLPLQQYLHNIPPTFDGCRHWGGVHRRTAARRAERYHRSHRPLRCVLLLLLMVGRGRRCTHAPAGRRRCGGQNGRRVGRPLVRPSAHARLQGKGKGGSSIVACVK